MRTSGADGTCPANETETMKRFDLPVELWDVITEYLRDDTDSLKSCSLICNAWTHRSQCRLFDTLSYSDRRKSGVAPPPDDLVSFISTSPHIAQHIHTLDLNRCTNFPFSSLLSILSCLRNLRDLKFDQVDIFDEQGDSGGTQSLSPPQQLMGPLKVFSFIDCNATSAVFHHILGLFPFIAHIKLSSGLWSSNTRSDNWTMYDSSELSSLSLTVDALYIYNLRWDTISTLLRHNSTIAKNITSLRLSMVFEYYSPRVVGELLVQMSSLRHVHIGPYPTHLGSSQLWMEYSHGQAFQDLRLSQCHQLESAEYSFLLTTNAAEMAVHLALLVQADLPASARELRFSFFESIPWCAAPPKSEADREAWTLLDRRMLHTPSRIRFCISNARDPRTQALDWQEVSVVQAFFDAALPGVTATGRLSVLGGAPVSPSASRSCACSACASPGGQ